MAEAGNAQQLPLSRGRLDGSQRMAKSHGQDRSGKQDKQLEFGGSREQRVRNDRKADKKGDQFTGQQIVHMTEIELHAGANPKDRRHEYLFAEDAGEAGQIRAVFSVRAGMGKQQDDDFESGAGNKSQELES